MYSGPKSRLLTGTLFSRRGRSRQVKWCWQRWLDQAHRVYEVWPIEMPGLRDVRRCRCPRPNGSGVASGNECDVVDFGDASKCFSVNTERHGTDGIIALDLHLDLYGQAHKAELLLRAEGDCGARRWYEGIV